VSDAILVDRRREGRSAIGWFVLDRSPLAFLRADERALFCDVALARALPVALPLSEVLSWLPAEPQ
jgi:hypothetical protein